MSEKEKQILDKIAQLPAPLQDKFLDRLEGARLAIDAIGTLSDALSWLHGQIGS